MADDLVVRANEALKLLENAKARGNRQGWLDYNDHASIHYAEIARAYLAVVAERDDWEHDALLYKDAYVAVVAERDEALKLRDAAWSAYDAVVAERDEYRRAEGGRSRE